MKNLLVLFILATSTIAFSQEQSFNAEQEMAFYGDVMVNATLPSNRLRAADKFLKYFQAHLDVKGTLDSLPFTRFISVLEPDDKKFKLISWHVQADNYEYDYYAFLLYPEGSYVRFDDNSLLNDGMDYEHVSTSEWYGALYYKLMKSGDDYLVFGFNANSQFTNKKVVDVLNFKAENLHLGKPIFEDKTDLGNFKNRLILDYSSDATVNLNYNPGLEMIVHDHLMQRIGRIPGQGPANIPDGTYEGYKFQDDKWMYNEKLYDHSYGINNAPRPKPILNTKRGETKKKKN